MDRLMWILKELKIPYAYDHFAQGEAIDPPFICYRYPSSDNFGADGIAYVKINVVHLELYTDKKDPELEKKIERLLDQSGYFYDKSETFIDSEKLYEVLYIFEEEANDSKE